MRVVQQQSYAKEKKIMNEPESKIQQPNYPRH